MSDWQQPYRDKSCSAAEAVALIQSGQHVLLAHAAAEPCELVAALLAQKDRLTDVEITHMVPLCSCAYCEPEYAGHFRHNALFVGTGSRAAVARGQADFTPCFFYQIPIMLREGVYPVDVACIQVAPPDADGNMSFGVSVDYTMQAAESAKYVVAEVNPRMPRTLGSSMHVSKVDAIVEVERALPEIPLPKIGPVEEKIGEHIASLVPDGGTLQLGIGAIPDAVLKFLGDKKDLGIHTEMFSDGVLDLYEQGVITNARKTLHPHQFVATFLIGTQRLYDFVDQNPAVLMRPVDYTNHPAIACREDRLISINSAIQVDLRGQVCADMIGGKQYSAVGGQVDFVRAASMSAGGKSILAFPSTTRDKSISRIVAQLDEGACVTTSRYDVQYVVTEYGIADLRCRTNRQRREALLAIAHPKFRQALEEDGAA